MLSMVYYDNYSISIDKNVTTKVVVSVELAASTLLFFCCPLSCVVSFLHLTIHLLPNREHDER